MLGQRIQSLRKERGMSQQALTVKTGIPQTTLSAWENERKTNLSADSVIKLADAFGVTTDYLLGRTDAPVTMHTTNTPYMQLAPIEKEVVERYRKAPSHLKDTICKLLDIEVAQTKHA